MKHPLPPARAAALGPRSTLMAALACAQVATAGAQQAEVVAIAEPATGLPGLTAPAVDGKRWRNPEGSPPDQSSWRDVVSLWWGFITAKREQTQPPTPAGHVLPREQVLAGLAAAQQQPAGDSLTWLGHASFLLRAGGKTVLTDPFLCDAASPFSSVGPKRHAGPGLAPQDLPPLDVVVISHNHYDHLDLCTLQQLPGKAATQLVVPVGVEPLVRDLGFAQVHELRWGESLQVGALRIVGAPAIHFSGRGLFDRDATLWAGFVFEAPQQRIFFAGDTAYHPTAFKALRERVGPVDVALLPIGAYEPRQMMGHVHVNPEEAVAIGRDLQASRLVGMHWGTIVLSTEPPYEPPERFRAAGRVAGMADDALWVMAIGETRTLPAASAAVPQGGLAHSSDAR